MNAEIWSIIGTIVATLVLFIVPGLVYTWYALEHLIDDESRRTVGEGSSRASPDVDANSAAA